MKKIKNELLTGTMIRELIFYDPETGKVYWKERDVKFCKNEADQKTFNKTYAGKEIISLDGKGYYRISVLSNRYSLHRIIHLYMTGEWPEVIDHINGIKTDNRWCNLRNVTQSVNRRNISLPSDNTSGVIGVWKRENNKWAAEIYVDKVKHSLGTYDTKEEAALARKIAEIKYGFSPTHGRTS